MRVKLEDLSPEKRAAVQDFKSDITSVFNDIYGDKWDQERWDRAIGGYFLRPFSLPTSDSVSNVYILIVHRRLLPRGLPDWRLCASHPTS